MLTIIPINSYKAKSTGNLEIKGIPAKSTRCVIKKWNQTVGRSVQCLYKANFVLCNTAPTFQYFSTGKRPYRFAGMVNTATLYCALDILDQINRYKIALQSKIINLEHSSNMEGRQRSERAKKMLKTKADNELNKIDDLILMVHRFMKKDKNIAADLLEQ
jgi:hypothetical protein